jgi:hypothetical protein
MSYRLNAYLRDQERGEALADYAELHGITEEEALRRLEDEEDARREAYAEAMAEAEACRWDDDPDPYSGTYSED